MNGCNCCIAGATPTPDTTDPCVCNAGAGAVFVGSTGALFVRTVLTNPCAVGDWAFLYDVDSHNNCVNGGVGALYAIREAGFIGNELFIDGAPEHTTARGILPQATSAFGPYAHPGPPDTADVTLLVERDLIFTNPSPCRALNYHVIGNALILFEGANASFKADFEVYIKVGGVLVSSHQVPATSGASTRSGWGGSVSYVEGVAAATPVTLTVGFRLHGLNGGWTGNAFVKTALTVLGSTV